MADGEKDAWEEEALRLDAELRPFLVKVCGARLAWLISAVLLFATEFCAVPILRTHNHEVLRNVLAQKNEFETKGAVGGLLLGVLCTCTGSYGDEERSRPITDRERELARHLGEAATLMDAYDPLGRV